mmetsp:Transcript_22302/g.40824  ORF Transcript_22302/g.40824 Transcript_22302/m.40824 type:complete len:245 (-) Transcript_22302:119-853(-)
MASAACLPRDGNHCDGNSPSGLASASFLAALLLGGGGLSGGRALELSTRRKRPLKSARRLPSSVSSPQSAAAEAAHSPLDRRRRRHREDEGEGEELDWGDETQREWDFRKGRGAAFHRNKARLVSSKASASQAAGEPHRGGASFPSSSSSGVARGPRGQLLLAQPNFYAGCRGGGGVGGGGGVLLPIPSSFLVGASSLSKRKGRWRSGFSGGVTNGGSGLGRIEDDSSEEEEGDYEMQGCGMFS